jgi:hypothetical protein
MRTFFCALLFAAGCIGHIGDGGRVGSEDAPAPDPGATPARGPDLLRRLTRAEYARTVEALTGVEIPAVLLEQVPEDAVDDETGFANQARELVMQTEHAVAYQRVAEHVVAEIVADPAGREALVGCEPTAPACLSELAARLGRLAYRRPLEDGEVEALVALAESAAQPGDPWSATGVIVEALLQSGSFLLRPEAGAAPAETPGAVRLTGSELATRIAFLAWGTGPDDALLERAEAGELDEPSGLAAVIEDVLSDPRTREGLAELGRQWFELERLDGLQLDPALYPMLTESLRAAMKREVEELVGEHLAGDAAFTDLLTTAQGYADEELANLYGVALPDPAGGFQRIEFGTEQARGGLLGTAGMLAMTSSTTRTSPVRRGFLVRSALMCPPPPPPPPDVEQQLDQEEDPIDALDAHSSDPSCAACHQLLDPIGWGLDRYDAVGALRTENEQGEPVRQEGFLLGQAGGDFGGAAELGALVAAAPEMPACVVSKVFAWTFARSTDGADTSDAEQRFTTSGYRVRELLMELMLSDAFRERMLPNDEEQP